ncbi:stemmadenine O-acetyltransferase-like [Punica granatum]|uniref:Stemmadenine O-acetyltransferase-like n=1 Tax=Punica granatum TaxID=22663 RepID=A0A218XYP6_PUNGR|nr:stemmadenine O-acetyltransferase-like [Punica granatum]OWM89719.1 hypothetical protein CDL15_Pgr024467 [Punica granatum]
MKVFEVEVLSKETIKPASPTPDHLRHYSLSFLDQISPPVFMPLVIFFPKDDISNEEKCGRIKKSLSEALARFYPMAGRVKDNMYIDCNDEGAHYVEARAHCDLVDVLKNPVPGSLNKFLPFGLDDVNELAAAVQVNIFNCGGLAISLLMSHKVADALSYFTFLNSWAAIARGETNLIINPCFDSATLFPPVDMSGLRLNMGIVKENIVTKRFVFDAPVLASLREKYNDATSEEYQRPPTRVEALSTFLWSRYMASTQVKEEAADEDNNNKLYSVLHAVNLRTRMDPALSERHFGNISRIAVTRPNTYISGDAGYKIVNQVRDAIRQVNVEYVKKLQQGDGHLNSMRERGEKISKGDFVSFSFTSLCRFPIYEADFGWGKPVWVGSASLTFKNLIVFLDTKSGDGIEAWANLKAEDMAKFENDKELLAYASPNINVKSYIL